MARTNPARGIPCPGYSRPQILDLSGQRGYDRCLYCPASIRTFHAARWPADFPPVPRMLSKLFCQSAAASAVVLMTAVDTVLAQAGGGDAQAPALVQIETARETHMAPRVWVPGTIVSRDDARVAAEVSGRLVFVAEVGTAVGVSDPLARIDDTELRIELAEAEAVVGRETARHEFAEREWHRLKGLADKGLVTKSRLDQARSSLQAAQGEARVADARLSLVRDRLARTVVSAPFGGVVAERYRRSGERVAEGDEVVRLVSPYSLEAQVFVPPATLPHVTLGTTVTVSSNPLERMATVRSVVPIGDERSRLYEVRVALPEDMRWPAGTSVRVAVPTATPRTVIAVPRDALVLRQEGVTVYRLTANDVAEGVPVETGIASGPWIEVTGAIQPGDRVITRGGERIRSGQSVTIMPSTTPES